MSTVVALFRQYHNAEQAMDTLQASGFDLNEISAIVPEQALRDRGDATTTGGTPPTVVANTTGNVPQPGILGLGGTIAGLKGTAMPDLGTVRTTGSLLSAEVPNTAKSGEVTKGGQLAQRLIDRGIPAADAEVYAEGVRRGHVLLAVDTDRIADAKTIMNQYNAADTTALAKGWEHEGWQPGARD